MQKCTETMPTIGFHVGSVHAILRRCVPCAPICTATTQNLNLPLGLASVWLKNVRSRGALFKVHSFQLCVDI